MFCIACPNTESVEIGELSKDDSIVRTYKILSTDDSNETSYKATFKSTKNPNKSFRLTYPSRLILDDTEFWHEKTFVGGGSYYQLFKPDLEQKDTVFHCYDQSGELIEDVVEVPHFAAINDEQLYDVSLQKNHIIEFQKPFHKLDKIEVSFSSSSWESIDAARVAHNRIVISKKSLARILNRINKERQEGDPELSKLDSVRGSFHIEVLRQSQQKSSDGSMLNIEFRHIYSDLKARIQ